MARRFRFSKKAIAALPPAEGKPYEVYDDYVHRLALRVHPGGRRTFYVIQRAIGKTAWVSGDLPRYERKGREDDSAKDPW